MPAPPPEGVCPVEPEDPISEEAFDAFVAAMEALVAEAPPASKLDEAWSQAARDAALAARRAKMGEQELSATPYRGTAPPDDHYFDSNRWKAFQNQVHASAERNGVEVRKVERVRGVWAGEGEPSAHITVRGDTDAVHHVADDIGSAFDQDAVMHFRRDPKGKAVKYTSTQPVERAKVEAALKGKQLGATVRADGRVEMVDMDGSQVNDVRGVLDHLNVPFEYHHGHADLRKAEKDYERASTTRARDRRAATVRASAAGGANAGGRSSRGRNDADEHLAEVSTSATGGTASFVAEAFDPAQHRGPDGRWVKDFESGQVFHGSRPDEALLGPLPVPIMYGQKGRSPLTAQELRDYGRAIRESVKRHPELLTGRYPLQSVDFLQNHQNLAVRANVLDRSAIATVYVPAWGGQRVVINDKRPSDLAVAEHLAPASRTPRGAMTHEMGHVFFRNHNLTSTHDISRRLQEYGITPLQISTLTRYGAASNREALAELYAQHFTPGFKIEDPELRTSFGHLVDDLRKSDHDSN